MGRGRAVLIVLDGVGVGALPDAYEYNKVTYCNSIANVAEAMGGLHLPNLEDLGLGSISIIKGVKPKPAQGVICKLAPLSKANDSVPLHWEMMGVITGSFPIYKSGLPKHILKAIENVTGQRFIGNITVTTPEQFYSLIRTHMEIGDPIIYCTNDSVVQIAAAIEKIPPKELYEIASMVRRMLTGKHAVLRVVAKPFTVKEGRHVRLEHLRKDFTLPIPSNHHLLGYLLKKGIPIIALGKVYDFFPGVFFSKNLRCKNNQHCLNLICRILEEEKSTFFIFANLIEFDVMGHSKDIEGYAQKLEEFDAYIPEILYRMHDKDLLIITGDHGCDPTIPQVKTHTREYVPLIIYRKSANKGYVLGIKRSFTNIASILSLFFNLNVLFEGVDLNLLKTAKNYISEGVL